MKKFISMAMALVMALSLCVVVNTTEAKADFADADQLSSKYAVQAADVIQTIEVMDGYDDGTFRPTAGLTRQAAAKIICNMILGPTTARALPTNANPFPDVLAGNQFSGYVSYCAQQGIISGYADGTFRGGDPLSGYAYLKMLLGALGYDAQEEGFVGDNWKVNVAKTALGIKLNRGIDTELDGTTQVTREEAAIYAFNTLQADMVEYAAKNTINVNGVTVSMGGSNATPQTWNTSSTSNDNINSRRSDGNNARPIVQFAERYFDKLKRTPNVWDTYTQDDFGRPSIKWEWKGVEIGTYSRDPDATFVGGVDVNEIYEALRESTGMSSGDDTASLYINSSQPNRGIPYTITTGALAGTIGYNNAFSVERANDSGLGDMIAKNAAGRTTSSDTRGGAAAGRNVDRIGDGTLIECFRNDATNHVDVCVISVYGGKVDSVKGATTKKDAYVTISAGDRRPDSINNVTENREFETEDFEEDDVVAYTYSDSAASIKSMYLMTPESGTLQSRVTGKSLRLGDTTYSYGKEYSFDDMTENNLSTKSSYIVYLDENDYVLWVEEDEFSVDDYVLIERITIETTVNNVTTKTASVIGEAEVKPSTEAANSVALQTAYNQSKDAVGNSTWDAQAQVRYANGTRRTVTLDDSKNYRTSTTSDGYVRINAGNVEQYEETSPGVWGWVNKGTAGAVFGTVTGSTIGNDNNGNWIAEPFTAGHIVRLSSNSSGYRLHSINPDRFYVSYDFYIGDNQIHSNDEPSTFHRVIDTNNQQIIADSETHFAVEDKDQGSFKSYLGIKNAPDVELIRNVTTHHADNAVAYIYHNDGTAKLIFVLNGQRVTNSSSDILFLAANSTSNLVESDDGRYYEVSAVDKNEVKTVMIKQGVSFTSSYAGTFTPGNSATEDEAHCVILNRYSTDSNDFIISGSYASADVAQRVRGIRRVSSEEVRLGTSNSASSTLHDVADNVRVYFVDGDDIDAIDYSEIVNDTSDYVYYIEEKGEITYLFIVDYDGPAISTTPTPVVTPVTFPILLTGVNPAYTVVEFGSTPPTAPANVTTGTELKVQITSTATTLLVDPTTITVALSYQSRDGSLHSYSLGYNTADNSWSYTIPLGADILTGSNITFVVAPAS